ncbi:MAG: transposase family protein [Pseudonocardiaceae bacterium]
MSEVPMAAADAVVGELVTHAVSLHAASGGDLLGCFASVVDPRDPRGVRHSLATILAMCTAAVLCGCTSLDDITAWVGSADRGVLAVLGCRRNALEVLTPPRPETVTRVFAELGAQALAGHAGVLLARRAGLAPVAFPISAPGWLPAIAGDGKALRGAAGTDGGVPTYWPPPPTTGARWSPSVSSAPSPPRCRSSRRCCASSTTMSGCRGTWSPSTQVTPSAPTPPSSARNSGRTTS